MYLFNFCIFVISVLIQSSLGNSIPNTGPPILLNNATQSSLGNSIPNTGPPILLNNAYREFEHVNATNSTDKDYKDCEAIYLQRILSAMMTMLRQDLSENAKTAYLLETLKDLLKTTAANNKEVTDKVDDLLRTLDKYKEPMRGNSLRTETDKDSPLRILIRKPTKPNDKLQFKYELPNLSNSYCTRALVNIAKIAYQAYVSLAENPICNLPGLPDYPTKDRPFSESSDLQSLDNLMNDPFQEILPAYDSNPIFEDTKNNLKDFKNVLALYEPINSPKRPKEFIPEVDQVPYESNPLYPGDVNQGYNPFFPQNSDLYPSDLYSDKPKYILKRPKEIPNGLNDQNVPYESNPFYPGNVDQGYNPFIPDSQDSYPSDLYPNKPKEILNRPEDLIQNIHNHKVPYESNPLYPIDVNQDYNPYFPQSSDSPFDLYPNKQKHIPNRPDELLLPNELKDQEVPYESNPFYSSDVNQAYNPFFSETTDTLAYDLYSNKPNKNQTHFPFVKKPSNPFNYLYPDGKHILPKDLSIFPWENTQSPSTDFLKPDQDLINTENMAIDIPLNNPYAIDIPIRNPNAPNKYPLNHYGYPDNLFTPNEFLPQTRPKKSELYSLLHPLSPNNDNIDEPGVELPSAPDTGYNSNFYNIQLNPNVESDVEVFYKNPRNKYEAEPYISSLDDASSDRDDSSSNEDDERPKQSPYDLVPKTPSDNTLQDNYITPSSSLKDKDLEVIGFIKDAIDAIEEAIPAIEFDPQTSYVKEEIKNILVNEHKDLEINDYEVILELYKQIINYIKQLNGYDQIIDRIDLSRVTNSSKLENKKVVELTYLVKRPKPLVYYPYYYVKYRLPYPSFVNAAQNLLKPKQLRMNPNQYEDLLARSQVVETSPDLKNYEKKDLMGLIVQSGSLINAKLVGENTTLSDHLDALKDITSDLSAEELLKLNKDASSKLNFLAGSYENINLYETISELSSPLESPENNANSAIKPLDLFPQNLRTNQLQKIANSETVFNSNIHHTTEPSALTTFDSTKLRSTLLGSKLRLPFSDHSNNDNLYQASNNLQEREKTPLAVHRLLEETINTSLRERNQQNLNSNNKNLLHKLYQPSSILPEREKTPPAVYKLLEETINTSLRGRNQQNLNSQANIDSDKTWSTVEEHPTNILKPKLNTNTAQFLKRFDNTKASSAFFNKMYMVKPKTIEDNLDQKISVARPENMEQTIAGISNVAQHSYGAPANEEASKLLENFDEQYFQPSEFVNQSSDDFDYQTGLKELNQDTIGSTDNEKKPLQITNQSSFPKFKTGPESPKQNFPEPDAVLEQKQNMSASNHLISNGQAIPNQQNPPLLTSNQQTYTLGSNANLSPTSLSNPQNIELWTNKGSPDQITISQNFFESSAKPSQENHLKLMSDSRKPDLASPSQQNFLPPESNPNSPQQNRFESPFYPRNPDQANPRQQNLPPEYPVNSGQNPQHESHQIWINPASGQQVIPSQQSSGHGTMSQQNIGIYSSSPDTQQAIAHQQNVYNTKGNSQATQSQENDLSTGSYSPNLGLQAIDGQQNSNTQETWINNEIGQQKLDQQSYNQGIGMYPPNPSAVQQAILSQQNVYNTNKAMHGQQHYNLGYNAKRYVMPRPLIYKRPVIKKYTYPIATQYSRPIVANYLG